MTNPDDPPITDAQRYRIIRDRGYRRSFLIWLSLRLEASDDIAYRREAAQVMRWVVEGLGEDVARNAQSRSADGGPVLMLPNV